MAPTPMYRVRFDQSVPAHSAACTGWPASSGASAGTATDIHAGASGSAGGTP